jgi:hypothetical protein
LIPQFCSPNLASRRNPSTGRGFPPPRTPVVTAGANLHGSSRCRLPLRPSRRRATPQPLVPARHSNGVHRPNLDAAHAAIL